jgi:hypothetical protein
MSPFCQGRQDFPSQVFRRSPIQPIVLRSPSLMTEPRFTIGQSVFYRAGRVKEGPFRVLAVLPQRRDKARYRVRREDDETVEYVADECELSTT